MNPLFVAVDEVHQVYSPTTGKMSTTLILDVFGHRVELPVDDEVIRGVIEAAVAQAEPVPIPDLRPELSAEDAAASPDPTIPIPEVGLSQEEQLAIPKIERVFRPTELDEDDGFEAM